MFIHALSSGRLTIWLATEYQPVGATSGRIGRPSVHRRAARTADVEVRAVPLLVIVATNAGRVDVKLRIARRTAALLVSHASAASRAGASGRARRPARWPKQPARPPARPSFRSVAARRS